MANRSKKRSIKLSETQRRNLQSFHAKGGCFGNDGTGGVIKFTPINTKPTPR